MLISSPARSQVVLAFRSTAPYSVTTKLVMVRGTVTIVAGSRAGTIRDTRCPVPLSLSDGRQMNDLPPLEWKAP